jgi:hypothetical protein
MKLNTKKAKLNRPVFTQRQFDSRSITVLTTLIRRFQAPGEYEIFVQRDGNLVQRIGLRVADDYPDHQFNIDLAGLERKEKSCSCTGLPDYKLKAGGVIGFFVSEGTGKYTIKVNQLDNKSRKKNLLLDNTRILPKGDLFAVTLVLPGIYRVLGPSGDKIGEITVKLPTGERKYRPDRPILLKVGDGVRLEREKIGFYSGQSIVFQCETDVSLRIELEKADDIAGPPIAGKSFSFRKQKSKRP